MKLVFPEKILDQHLVVLGKTGAGKSSALRHMVEHLLQHKKRVCIIDPKGDWWGLKSSADGQSAGFPVIAFGNFKEEKAADIPINDRSGRSIAELIAGGNRPCIIGFRGWMPGQMTRFWLEFAPTLFNSNAGELYLVIDEVHNFAAKGKIMDVEGAKCLHWTNRLMSEGRGVGLVCLIASQRPQKVHNDTLTCCETLVAMRVNHAADRQATKDWIDGCGDKAQGNEVLANIAGLPRGEAYVWSPEIGFGPQRVKFPMFETFDSFAPPQLQKKVSAKGWETTDLEAVKVKLAKVIEEEKARDPAELNKIIAGLRKSLAEATKSLPAAPPKTEVINVPIFPEADRAIIRDAVVEMRDLGQSLKTFADAIEGRVATMQQTVDRFHVGIDTRRLEAKYPTNPKTTVTVRKTTFGAEPTVHDSELDESQRKILDVVAMLGVRGIDANVTTVARWLGIHPKGGRYGTNLGLLRSQGYLAGFSLTSNSGGLVRPMETGLDRAKATLDDSQCKIVDALADDPGNHFSVVTLAERLGIHPKGGRYGTNLGLLRAMELIPERGGIFLTPAVYQ